MIKSFCTATLLMLFIAAGAGAQSDKSPAGSEKPITAKVQGNVLPTIFHIDLPEELSDEVEKCKDNVAVRQVGVEWAVKQSKELIKFGVPTLHFYSMGKSDPIYKIGKQLF